MNDDSDSKPTPFLRTAPKRHPLLGLRVIYTLNADDVRAIVQNRRQAGQAVHRGNDPREGDMHPALIVKCFGMTGDEIKARVGQMCKEYAESKAFINEGNPHAATRHGRELVERFPTMHQFDAHVKQVAEGLAKQAASAGVNLQVFLDGNDTYWATSRSEYDPEKHGAIDKDAPDLALLGVMAEGADQKEIDEVERQNREALERHRANYWRPRPEGHWQRMG